MNNEQLRLSSNLAVAYDEWLASSRTLTEYADNLSWKEVSGRSYLYRVEPRTRIGRSMGPRSAALEAYADQYLSERERLLQRLSGVEDQIKVMAPLCRAARLPMISPAAGAILRQADVGGLLGGALMVVGTLTMPAYEMEAQARFATGLDATEDCDLCWTADKTIALAVVKRNRLPLTSLMKAVDPTYTVNLERTFQIRNARAYEIEVLAAPGSLDGYPAFEPLRPLEMPSQGWLTLGRPVSQVVLDLSGRPARIHAPDPRMAALHKLWLSKQPDRDRLKAPKDRSQALALAASILEGMPHYPIDADFIEMLPSPLRPFVDSLWPGRPVFSDDAAPG